MNTSKESPSRARLTAGLRILELAIRWKVNRRKILAWIRSGRLEAINTASDQSSRPQYLILPEAIDSFERDSSCGKTKATAKAKPRTAKIYV